MASSHGIPRVVREDGGEKEKEKEQIREYRALIDFVNAKVRDNHTPTPIPVGGASMLTDHGPLVDQG